jgi:phosphoribosyl 1,2-cyclic phosphodiesterase
MTRNTAQIRFWGVRGSTPTVDQATTRYGGNTPCLELTTPHGTRFILDCGTGVRMLGNHLAGCGISLQGAQAISGNQSLGNQGAQSSNGAAKKGPDDTGEVDEHVGNAQRAGASQAVATSPERNSTDGITFEAANDAPLRAHIFLTHYHWDHIQGIPFFAPLYSPQNQFHFYSFRSKFLGRDSLKQVFETQMAYPYFPVNVNAMTAKREFTEISGGETFQIDDAKVSVFWLNHPQGCLGFRFETSAGVIAYATDNEPGDPELDKNLLKLAANADIFINDAQYTPEQLAGPRRGWGHSSWLAGTTVAREARARNLVLFHHDPDSSDRAVDGLLRRARQHFDNVWAAAEGMAMGLGAQQMDVHLPTGRSGQRSDGNLRAVVTGYTTEGRAFQEETVIRDLTLQGAMLYLSHSPRLQSELQVEMGDPGKENPAEHPMKMRGYVVKLEPGPVTGHTAVGVVFTE